jgi:hypothetical protein
VWTIDGGKTATCTVTVPAGPGLTLSGSPVTISGTVANSRGEGGVAVNTTLNINYTNNADPATSMLDVVIDWVQPSVAGLTYTVKLQYAASVQPYFTIKVTGTPTAPSTASGVTITLPPNKIWDANHTKVTVPLTVVGTITYNIVKAPEYSAIPALTPLVSASYNAGAAATALSPQASVSDGGTLSYVWQKIATGADDGFAPISGATGAAYTPVLGAAGTTAWYKVVVTNTKDGVTAVATSTVAEITVLSASARDLTAYIDAPTAGNKPGLAAFVTPYYPGVITWAKTEGNPSYSGDFSNGGEFYADAVYTATVTLTARDGYTFTGVGLDAFTYKTYGHVVSTAGQITNPAGSGDGKPLTVTIVFPKTVDVMGGS